MKSHDEKNYFDPDITVLCARPRSVYKQIQGLDVWDEKRNAYNYSGTNPIIAHPPCAQWSRLKGLANENAFYKDLAMFCLERIQLYGGILEQPEGSSFFKYAGIKPTLSIDQFWFGYPIRKRTWLYIHGFKPLPVPLRFDAIEKMFGQLTKPQRSFTTMQLAMWFVDTIRQ